MLTPVYQCAHRRHSRGGLLCCKAQPSPRRIHCHTCFVHRSSSTRRRRSLGSPLEEALAAALAAVCNPAPPESHPQERCCRARRLQLELVPRTSPHTRHGGRIKYSSSSPLRSVSPFCPKANASQQVGDASWHAFFVHCLRNSQLCGTLILI